MAAAEGNRGGASAPEEGDIEAESRLGSAPQRPRETPAALLEKHPSPGLWEVGLDAAPLALAASPDGRVACLPAAGGPVICYDRHGRNAHRIDLPDGFACFAAALSFAEDGRLGVSMVRSSGGAAFAIYDSAYAKLWCRIENDEAIGSDCRAALAVHGHFACASWRTGTAIVKSVYKLCSADGAQPIWKDESELEVLAFAGVDSEWRLLLHGKCEGKATLVLYASDVEAWRQKQDYVTAAAFGPNDWVVSGRMDGSLTFWSAGGAQLRQIARAFAGVSGSSRVGQLAFLGDGRLVASMGGCRCLAFFGPSGQRLSACEYAGPCGKYSLSNGYLALSTEKHVTLHSLDALGLSGVQLQPCAGVVQSYCAAADGRMAVAYSSADAECVALYSAAGHLVSSTCLRGLLSMAFLQSGHLGCATRTHLHVLGEVGELLLQTPLDDATRPSGSGTRPRCGFGADGSLALFEGMHLSCYDPMGQKVWGTDAPCPEPDHMITALTFLGNDGGRLAVAWTHSKDPDCSYGLALCDARSGWPLAAGQHMTGPLAAEKWGEALKESSVPMSGEVRALVGVEECGSVLASAASAGRSFEIVVFLAHQSPSAGCAPPGTLLQRRHACPHLPEGVGRQAQEITLAAVGNYRFASSCNAGFVVLWQWAAFGLSRIAVYPVCPLELKAQPTPISGRHDRLVGLVLGDPAHAYVFGAGTYPLALLWKQVTWCLEEGGSALSKELLEGSGPQLLVQPLPGSQFTLLHWFVQQGKTEVVQMLCKLCVEKKAWGGLEKTASGNLLDLAVETKNPDIIRAVLDYLRQTPFWGALAPHWVESLHKLIANIPDAFSLGLAGFLDSRGLKQEHVCSFAPTL